MIFSFSFCGKHGQEIPETRLRGNHWRYSEHSERMFENDILPWINWVGGVGCQEIRMWFWNIFHSKSLYTKRILLTLHKNK